MAFLISVGYWYEFFSGICRDVYAVEMLSKSGYYSRLCACLSTYRNF